jgi:hypothetical protein
LVKENSVHLFGSGPVWKKTGHDEKSSNSNFVMWVWKEAVLFSVLTLYSCIWGIKI